MTAFMLRPEPDFTHFETGPSAGFYQCRHGSDSSFLSPGLGPEFINQSGSGYESRFKHYTGFRSVF